MKIMRFLIRVFELLCLTMLVSCVDYVQSISIKNGVYNLYYKVTLSKMLDAMGEGSAESFFDDDIDSFNMPRGAKANKIDTELESGIQFSIPVEKNTKDSDEKALLPVIKGNLICVPFPIGDTDFTDSVDLESDTGAMTAAILSSAKCRIIICKDVARDVSNVYFSGADSNYPIPFYDYGEAWCAEIPFIIMFQDNFYDFSHVYFVTK